MKLCHSKVIFRVFSLKWMWALEKEPQNREPRRVRSHYPVNQTIPISSHTCLPWSVAVKSWAAIAGNPIWMNRFKTCFNVSNECRVLCKYFQCPIVFYSRALKTLFLILVKSLLVKQILFLPRAIAIRVILNFH